MNILKNVLAKTDPDDHPQDRDNITFHTIWADGRSPNNDEGEQLTAVGFLCACKLIICNESISMVAN